MSKHDAAEVEEAGTRKAICGYTWPGIEYGEPPCCAYTFFEYADAIRFGDLPRFKRIEAACQGWYFPTLDRGAGALLHFAADHGQLEAARFLVQQRQAELFEFLLESGADPEMRTFPAGEGSDPGSTALELAVRKGHEWQEGEVRSRLAALVQKYRAVPKRPEFVYDGPPVGTEASHVLACWEALPKLYPPPNWRSPPPAGFVGAAGMRSHAAEPWRPAGDGDASCFVRPMTEAELQQQAQLC